MLKTITTGGKRNNRANFIGFKKVDTVVTGIMTTATPAAMPITRTTCFHRSTSYLLIVLVLLAFVKNYDGAVVASTIQCPTACDCSRLSHGIIADCFRRDLTELPLIEEFDPDTVSIDLRYNSLSKIPSDAFADLPRLGWLGLDHNRLETLEQYAFRGLENLTHLSFTHNRLTTLRPETFHGLTGSAEVCPDVTSHMTSEATTCHIDLTNNDIVLVSKNAFAWVKRLSILLGGAPNVGLLVDKYGFYGLSHAPKISFSNLNSVTLRPYAFTNVQYVGVLELDHTEMSGLDTDSFAGLEHVGELRFEHCQLGVLKTYSLGGITYLPNHPRTSLLATNSNPTPEVGYAGGLLNMSNCDITRMEKDVARDTNLERIHISQSIVGEFTEHVFRGLHRLKKLELLYNRLGELGPRSLGSLHTCKELYLHGNAMTSVAALAFEGSKDIDEFRIALPFGSTLTLQADSFSELVGVARMEFIGLPPNETGHRNSPLDMPPGESNGGDVLSKARLIVMPDAFSGLMAEFMTFTNLHLPVITSNAFRGLTKVTKIRLVDCDVTRVERGAFGESFGAIQHLDMSEGNQLPCDCQTRDTVRELNNVMSEVKVSCMLSEGRRISVEDSDIEWPQCISAARQTSGVHLHTALALSLTVFILKVLSSCS